MTALDLTALSPEVTLLGTTFVTGPRAALTSTPVTGFSDVASATIVTRVERVDNSNGETLSLTVQGSDDGNTWTTVAGPYTFAREGTQSIVVDDPADRLRVTWGAARGVREAVIGSVTARLGVVDAPGGGTVTTTPATVSTDPNTYIGTHVFDLGHATVYTATLTLTAFSGDGETLGGTPGDIQLSISHEMSFDGITYVNGLANVAGGAAYPDNTFLAVDDPGYYAGPTMRYLRFQIQWEDSNFDEYAGPNNPVGTVAISVECL